MSVDFSGLQATLHELDQQGLYRSRRVMYSPQGVEINIDGRQVINFSANDYLGLANHPLVVRAFKEATDAFGVGSGSAHLICGHSHYHHELELALAEFTGRERALLFSTGYMANLGIISALTGQGDQVLQDRLNHASLLDGGILSGARFRRYSHQNVTDLDNKARSSCQRTLVVTDGVFSMDGDLAPLPELVDWAAQHHAWLMVDDAHGFGVLGETGGGVLQHFALNQQQVPILMATLGKSLGTFGAFVAGSEALIETMLNKARSYVFTTALPPAIAAATLASLTIVKTEQWRRDQLQQLIAYFRLSAQQLGLQLMPTACAIQPLIVGESQRAVAMSEALLNQGFLVSAIRPPTVPQGQARLRITFSAHHSMTQVEQLLDALDGVC